MGDTVSNHDLIVVTKGTSHLATTQGATDVCLDPTKTVPAPYPNFVTSGQLDGGKTTKTLISGKEIVTKVGVIEPPSLPPHAGTGKGVVSGTYCDKAEPTQASPDVKAEGNGVCRSGDSTVQNSANTTGAFTPPGGAVDPNAEKEKQKTRCTITKVIGKCSHGRELDFPPNAKREGDGYYLEILSDDSVTLTSTRINAYEKGKGPECPPGDLTRWVAVRTGNKEPKKEKKQQGVDTFVIDTDLIGIPSIDSLNAKYGTKGKLTDEQAAGGHGVNPLGQQQQQDIQDGAMKHRPTTAKEDYVRQQVADGKPVSSTDQGILDRRDAKRQAYTDKASKEQGNANKLADKKFVDAAQVVQNLAKLALIWNALRDPVVIQVEASACSGAKNVTLRVFPSGKFSFDLFSEKVSQSVQKIKMVGELIKKVGDLFGKKVQFTFLSKPKLTLSVEYKELKKDWPKNNLIKSQVNRAFEGAVSFETFLSVKGEWGIPILNFFGPMGAAVNLFINAVGLEGTVYFSAEIAFTPVGSVKFDEYEETYCSFNMTVKIEFQIGCRIRWKDWAEIWCSGYVETTITFPEARTQKEHPLQVKFSGQVQLGVKGGAWADIWGWKKSVDFNYRPPDWKYKMGEGWLSFLPMP